MASEQEEGRDRQLEALRRYMVRLNSQWEPPTQLGIHDELMDSELAGAAGRRRPPLRWVLLAGLLVIVALVGGVVVGAVAWSDNRPAEDVTRATIPASTDRAAPAPRLHRSPHRRARRPSTEPTRCWPALSGCEGPWPSRTGS